MVAVTAEQFLLQEIMWLTIFASGWGEKKSCLWRVCKRRPRLHARLSVAISSVRGEVVVIVCVTGS